MSEEPYTGGLGDLEDILSQPIKLMGLKYTQYAQLAYDTASFDAAIRDITNTMGLITEGSDVLPPAIRLITRGQNIAQAVLMADRFNVYQATTDVANVNVEPALLKDMKWGWIRTTVYLSDPDCFAKIAAIFQTALDESAVTVQARMARLDALRSSLTTFKRPQNE